MEQYKIMIIKFLENPFLIFFLLLLSLNYSYFLIPKFPKGIPRIILISPIFYILYFLPWCFSFAFLRGILSFFITWITSFKLILFCFNKGPLSLCKNPIDFILISILPLKISIFDEKSVRNTSDKLIYDQKIVDRKYEISDKTSIKNDSNESISDLKDVSQKYEIFDISICKRYDMEEIFKQPYLATSFRDFWGKRWNRYSSKMLRLTIYDPTNEALKNLGKNTSNLLAIVCTFVVSAIMHELMFYYITCGLCLKPTCEVMWFFVLQGICISFEKFFYAKNWAIMDARISILLKRIFIVFSFYFLLVLPVVREGKNTCEVTK
ncbi:acyl-CoA--sterol O-acyltransferase 1-like [Solanum pennellii]|uniref:Acyl-CoA--sterol O-acyltransferase 1-like n=1 Tax=Solanum pennellii TaxID=28526 RepID=A0ABM1FRB3_SOLPN|nr:acyl-CoA--sterol O-acyltransferase 1-like [Solanum pennellii]